MWIIKSHSDEKSDEVLEECSIKATMPTPAICFDMFDIRWREVQYVVRHARYASARIIGYYLRGLQLLRRLWKLLQSVGRAKTSKQNGHQRKGVLCRKSKTR